MCRSRLQGSCMVLTYVRSLTLVSLRRHLTSQLVPAPMPCSNGHGRSWAQGSQGRRPRCQQSQHVGAVCTGHYIVSAGGSLVIAPVRKGPRRPGRVHVCAEKCHSQTCDVDSARFRSRSLIAGSTGGVVHAPWSPVTPHHIQRPTALILTLADPACPRRKAVRGNRTKAQKQRKAKLVEKVGWVAMCMCMSRTALCFSRMKM